MARESFRVHVVSDKFDAFPDNKAESFVTTFNPEINLEGDY
jgi:hypothetical protein